MEENTLVGINQEPQKSLITDKIKNDLKATKPWVRFLSIMGFISIGLGLISIIVMLVSMSFAPQGLKGAPFVMAFFYLIVMIIYLFPSLYLYKYASSIGTLLDDEKIESLETAVSYQKSFWKFVGITMVVSFVLGISIAVVMPVIIRQVQHMH